MTAPASDLFPIADSLELSGGRDILRAPEFRAEIDAWSRRLAKVGVTAGARVVVFGGKSPAQCALILAVLRLGAVIVPIYAGLKAAQVAHIVNDSEPLLAIAPKSGLHLFDESSIKVRMRLWSIEDFALVDAEQPLRSVAPAHLDDAALIVYTSGSTGLPKGVLFSRRNLLLGAQSVASFTGMRPVDRVLCLLPFSFDAGLNQFLAALSAGASIVLTDFIHPAPLAALCKRSRVSILTAVPGLLIRIADFDWGDAGSSIRLVCSTGGHLHDALIARLREIFSGAAIMPMYGFTEAFRCAYQEPEVARAFPGSLGKAIPHASFAILDQDGQPCSVDQPGELVQFGPLVTLGYWRRPELTIVKFRPVPPESQRMLEQPSATPFSIVPEHLSQLAWSGDMMCLDEQGHLRFVRRADAMIKANGFRISPTEIEDACLDEGAQAAVATAFGGADGDQIAVLWLAVAADERSASTIQAALATRLPRYMVPHFISTVSELPVNANGKVDRAKAIETLSQRFKDPVL